MVLKKEKLRRLERRKKKQNNNHKATVVGMDRISALPDALLLHILSFLSTKTVVSTSILSRRWRNLWTYIHVFDFREWWSLKEGEVERFSNFLDRLLLSHDDDDDDDISSIKEFYLTFDEEFDESRVNDWISTVVKRKVEKLKLYIHTSEFTIYPHLFTSGTLTDLEIQMHDAIRFPESISLPSLKILRLENVLFLDEKLMEQLFSNCPVLEKLGFKDCTWMGKIGSFVDEQIFLNFPVLQELMFIHTVRQRKFIYDIRISAPVLKYLSFVSTHTNFQGCRININAPSLLSLVYKEALARDYVLNSFGSLVTANIDLMFLTRLLQQNREEMVYAASKLIGMLSSVKLLKMSGYTFMALSLADDHMIHLPTLYNVVHLKVTKRFPDRTLLDFLQILPNLESLVFDKGFDYCQYNVDDSWTLNVVPQCLLLQLKSVEFRRFNGHPREMNLVKLFLKNARVLHTMFILLNDDWTDNVIETVDELLMFPRASSSCVVKFSFD